MGLASHRSLATVCVSSRNAARVKFVSSRIATGAVRMPLLPGRGALSVVRAADDFDSVVSTFTDKFEKSENKTTIIGYAAAATGALVFAEWFIHLPVLNFLLGGPIQLVGLLALPYLGVRYLVEKESVSQDVEQLSAKVTKLLPGMDK